MLKMKQETIDHLNKIKTPINLDKIIEIYEEGEYNAELLLQHLLLHVISDEHNYRLEGNEILYTFGGEYWDGDICYNDYGIDFEKCSIFGINSNQMKFLACQMVNHLMANGHKFQFVMTNDQDQPVRFIPND